MGIWEFVNSGTDAVKRNVPDLNTVQDACKTTYRYGATAVTKIDKVVRIDGLQTINSYSPDEKRRAQIGLFASKFAQNTTHYAVKEGFKMVPGGKAFADIVDKTIRDVKSETRPSIQENVAKKEIIDGNGEPRRYSTKRDMLDEVTEMQGKGMQISSEKQLLAYPIGNQKPEDVLRVFMMKEFIGSRFLDDLVIPLSRSGKGTIKSNFVP